MLNPSPNPEKTKWIQHAEGVYEIEEFLTEKTQNLFLSMIDDDGWATFSYGNIAKPINPENQLKIKELVSNKISSMFLNVSELTTIGSLRKLTKGDNMALHKDNSHQDDRGTIMFGIVIYLNDDFSGGELFYPSLNLNIKPKARSLVVHDAKLAHGVKNVTSGTRYCVTTFVFGNESTKLIVES